MPDSQRTRPTDRRRMGGSRRRGLKYLALICIIATPVVAAAAWLGSRASIIENELQSAATLLPQLERAFLQNDAGRAASSVEALSNHTATARSTAQDPLWVLCSSLPWLGPNLQAVTEVATSADDVARLAATPLVRALQSFDWGTLMPSGGGVDVERLADAQPQLSSAAHAVRESSTRLDAIDAGALLPQVSAPLIKARDQLGRLKTGLDSAADVSSLAPAMMGADKPRSYLLMIQNNGELRATGGIAGALAVLSVDQGNLSLGEQGSAGGLGTFTPPIEVDAEQRAIYSVRLGKYMQDVNLTPDFPTAARTAQSMWEEKFGQRVDGVISVDPVALGYILDAIGPVKITQPELVALASLGLPTELTGKNVVQTLLSDVYARIERPATQDAYFAGIAQEIFTALSNGGSNAKGLLDGLTRGTAESRILLWSGLPQEQEVIGNYPLSGSTSGRGVAPAQFGVYFNDGTGAKMDFYVKRTVQLIQECTADEYSRITVRITSTNTAPADAAVSLPAYVTGVGAFGIPPGTVQTNVTTYGPVQSNLVGAKLGGQETFVSSHRHDGRPVGTTTVTLAPGQASTVDMQFNKIVQDTPPVLRVTPTVQDLADVILNTETAPCAPAG